MNSYRKLKIRKRMSKHDQPYDPDYPIINHLKYPNVMNACRDILLKDGSGGTGFIFEYKGKNFLITAKHVIVESRRVKKKQISISIEDDQPLFFEAFIYYHFDKDIDLCVIPLPDNHQVISTLTYRYQPVLVGGDYFMFGYPGVIENTFKETSDKQKLPIPVIRSGIASHIGVSEGIHYMWLDMISVEGFSGGPVVAFDKSNNSHVIGVATDGNIFARPIVNKKGEEQDYYSYNSTGFTKAIHILYVIDIIEQNNLV